MGVIHALPSSLNDSPGSAPSALRSPPVQEHCQLWFLKKWAQKLRLRRTIWSHLSKINQLAGVQSSPILWHSLTQVQASTKCRNFIWQRACNMSCTRDSSSQDLQRASKESHKGILSYSFAISCCIYSISPSLLSSLPTILRGPARGQQYFLL